MPSRPRRDQGLQNLSSSSLETKDLSSRTPSLGVGVGFRLLFGIRVGVLDGNVVRVMVGFRIRVRVVLALQLE